MFVEKLFQLPLRSTLTVAFTPEKSPTSVPRVERDSQVSPSTSRMYTNNKRSYKETLPFFHRSFVIVYSFSLLMNELMVFLFAVSISQFIYQVNTTRQTEKPFFSLFLCKLLSHTIMSPFFRPHHNQGILTVRF